ncbi:MAG TPA: DNA mismatch repair endonuclease MutL [Spirochaeta sp.]|nr:DNA mismatch repair endonuclease MutL [Spirochaeta sp.]
MNKPITRRINILRDSVARRIAAGEVIDRPQAVVRELLDNSIDADASEISLHISGGGIDEIRVVDNGVGMDEENLKRCFLPHATSKISEFEDIYSTRTLGFRGEALSSIASCSKLSIVSSVSADEPANRLEIIDGSLRELSESKGGKGTVISVKNLFYSMPGRRNFLKSAAAESGQCRTMFIEKALPQLDKSFRYFVDDKLKMFLPASDLKERVISAYGSLFRPEFLQSFSIESDGIKLSAALGTPSLYRKDRKYIHVFINNRRISDYSLVQAVDYAHSSFLPGGCHPVCFLFLDIPPEHVDFNIHPAKREVKFRNLPSIHHTVTEAIGSYLRTKNSFTADISRSRNNNKQISQPVLEPVFDMPRVPLRRSSPIKQQTKSIFKRENLDSIAAELEPAQGIETVDRLRPETALIYLGQIFNLFLIFEHGENLMLVDQHAAHERIIFNSLSSKKPEVQELLVPLNLRLERDVQRAVERNLDEYSALGFELQKVSEGDWLINAMPALCSGMEDAVTGFFKNRINDAAELKKELFAMISCRSAIKDGDSIDDISALEIADAVLKMDNQRCPHGRPILQLISRDQLFRMFGRTF